MRAHTQNPRLHHGYLQLLQEISLLIGAYLMYLGFSLLSSDAATLAVSNAEMVLSWEKAVGFAWEAAWQEWALDTGRGVILLFNWVYVLAFWPVILPVSLILYIKNRGLYRYYRTVMLLSLAIALPVFGAFPMAPPLQFPSFVDTIQVYGPSAYGSQAMSTFYNTTAAMPSFHFAWALFLGLLFFRSGPTWLKVLGVTYPTLHFLAIIITGNHYLLDAVAGFVLALVSLLFHELFLRRYSLFSLLKGVRLSAVGLRSYFSRLR